MSGSKRVSAFTSRASDSASEAQFIRTNLPPAAASLLSDNAASCIMPSLFPRLGLVISSSLVLSRARFNADFFDRHRRPHFLPSWISLLQLPVFQIPTP